MCNMVSRKALRQYLRPGPQHEYIYAIANPVQMLLAHSYHKSMFFENSMYLSLMPLIHKNNNRTKPIITRPH